jgi:hypothetical protein
MKHPSAREHAPLLFCPSPRKREKGDRTARPRPLGAGAGGSGEYKGRRCPTDLPLKGRGDRVEKQGICHPLRSRGIEAIIDLVF